MIENQAADYQPQSQQVMMGSQANGGSGGGGGQDLPISPPIGQAHHFPASHFQRHGIEIKPKPFCYF